MMALNFSALVPSFPFILEGVFVTIKFTFFSLLCGVPLGIILGVVKASTCIPARIFADFYTSIFRGTPLLVQLGLIYFATPQLIGYSISAFEAGIITFSLNSAAYTSEIIRTGIQIIDKGQWEAAHVLGLSRIQTYRYIIFPLAVRNILPNLINEIIDLLKESALVSTIGEADLLQRAKIVAAEKFLYFEPYVMAALLYYVIVLMISFSAKRLEKYLAYA
jgi:polar amino acid transport system permease protein/polar amino acid transport system substrate-binding protein